MPTMADAIKTVRAIAQRLREWSGKNLPDELPTENDAVRRFLKEVFPETEGDYSNAVRGLLDGLDEPLRVLRVWERHDLVGRLEKAREELLSRAASIDRIFGNKERLLENKASFGKIEKDFPSICTDEFRRASEYGAHGLLSVTALQGASGNLAEELSTIASWLEEVMKIPQKKRTVEATEIQNQWKLPRGYIGSKRIVNDHNVPRSTLQGWAEQDKVNVKKDPQTKENYYLRKWFEHRLENYRPRSKT